MQIIKTSQLKEGMITAEEVKTKKGLTVVGKNVRLTSISIAHIAFYDIEQVHIQEQDLPKETAEERSTEPTYSQRVMASPQFKEFQTAYADAVNQLKETVAAILSENRCPDPESLCLITKPLCSIAQTSIEIFDYLHNMRAIADSIYAHSINVALIAYILGRWLKLKEADLNLLTAAGLLHDIGKTKIPAEILEKPGRYTDEEFDLVQKHPVFGYEILLSCESLDPRILYAASMHHERCDGSGYPNRLKFHDIDDFAQMIAIADVYDAMTAARPYRAPLCPFQVIADFEIAGLQKYNPKYILIFLERIAYTYQNNRVLLTDGRSANIVMLNKQFLSRPIVEVSEGILDLSKVPDIRIQALL